MANERTKKIRPWAVLDTVAAAMVAVLPLAAAASLVATVAHISWMLQELRRAAGPVLAETLTWAAPCIVVALSGIALLLVIALCKSAWSTAADMIPGSRP